MATLKKWYYLRIAIWQPWPEPLVGERGRRCRPGVEEGDGVGVVHPPQLVLGGIRMTIRKTNFCQCYQMAKFDPFDLTQTSQIEGSGIRNLVQD